MDIFFFCILLKLGLNATGVKLGLSSVFIFSVSPPSGMGGWSWLFLLRIDMSFECFLTMTGIAGYLPWRMDDILLTLFSLLSPFFFSAFLRPWPAVYKSVRSSDILITMRRCCLALGSCSCLFCPANWLVMHVWNLDAISFPFLFSNLRPVG